MTTSMVLYSKLIPLTQGKFARVGYWWYEWLNIWKWFAYKNKKQFYAARNSKRINGKRPMISMHQVVLGNKNADHKNINGLDNTDNNLRPSTNSQNMANKNKFANCSSKYKGVTWHKQHQKWYTAIKKDKAFFLGLFTDEIEAAKAYDKKAIELFGEFAVLNFQIS